MRRLASGVAIVVANGPDGPMGMAATSITSLTFNPPAVLVCVNRTASLHDCLRAETAINISVLSRNQQVVSNAFGGAVPREQRFNIGNWVHSEKNLPFLEGAQANLSCVVDQITPYGTHSIVIARVESVRLSRSVDPLIYQDGAYL